MNNWNNRRDNSSIIKGVIIGLIILILFIGIIFLNSAGVRRTLKTFGSSINNGMDRTITVYDYNGNEIKSWSGKFDVTESETGIMFDDSETGKRVIITNGIIINEEK